MGVLPIIKWAGGKRQLLEEILPVVPEFGVYCEPFLGGGAVLFALCPRHAIVNDINRDLISMYGVVRETPDKLIASLRQYKNTKNDFYRIRNLDREANKYSRFSAVHKAARLLYLNKTCYNGLYRVNANGQFNTPYGRYKRPNIVNAEGICSMSAYLNTADITLCCEDFAVTLERLGKGDFVYLDPPYDPLTQTANFTAYSSNGFGKDAQSRLKDCCDRMDEKGIKFLLSNSATPLIKELYFGYHMKTVQAKRNVNSVANGRGSIEELLIANYPLTGKLG